VAEALLELDGRRGALIVLSSLPPAVCALVLERPIERHLGTPATVAAGLLLGSAAMVRADGAPQERGREDAGPADAVWLGIAQASALMPGVSRNGATLVAARLRRFRREDANVLSRHVALPIILAASVLKGKRLAARGLPPGVHVAFAAGMAASFVSTLASTWLIRQVERDRSLLPYAAYRTALAGAVLIRAVRKNRRR
jgi:undecaprenyl-diphosphatase